MKEQVLFRNIKGIADAIGKYSKNIIARTILRCDREQNIKNTIGENYAK